MPLTLGPKLGKRAPREDARTLRLARYLPDRLPVPPAVDWSTFVSGSWPTYDNDTIGDCAVTAPAHLVQAWSAAVGLETTLDPGDVITAYSLLSGYDPARPEETDVGASLLDTMKRWRAHGIGEHKIEAFVAVDHDDVESLKAAVSIFGGAIIGLQLPGAARGRDTWDVTQAWAESDAARGSWGGHAVAAIAYAERGVLIVTWGELKWMTWDFYRGYADEAWTAISPDFLIDGRAPNGLDLKTLRADLARVAATPAPPASSSTMTSET